MTLGRKITLGFGILILISAGLGTLAVMAMKSVQARSKVLAEGYIPESQIAARLQDAFADAALASRTYGLVGDEASLASVRKSIAAVHQQQEAAGALAKAHPELAQLRDSLEALTPALRTYEGAVDQTETLNRNLAATRSALDRSAAQFLTNISDLIDTQKARLDEELQANASAAVLQERAHKALLLAETRCAGNMARATVFKAQALRDATFIQEALVNFDGMDVWMNQVAPMIHTAENRRQFDQVRTGAHAFRDTMKDLMLIQLALADLGKKRLDAMNTMQTVVGAIQTTGMDSTVEAAHVSNQRLATASWTMIGGVTVAVLLGAGVAFLIVRFADNVLTAVARNLDMGSTQVLGAAGQVSSASQSLATGASEQAASLEETSASLEEMASVTKRNSENAHKANDLAKQARTAADHGVTDMQTMARAMDAIKGSSDDIAKIIKTIDEIAFQTNILALNAAVEAARAGEAGMGFAVVADEVRNLAQRCAHAAKETSAKIEDAIAKSGQGVEITTKVTLMLNDIVNKVRQVDELAAEVATASREQTAGISQINTAVSQMDRVTQSNAASAEESAAAAEELNAQAALMKEAVSELIHLVGAHQGHAAAPTGTPSRPVRSKPLLPALPVRNGENGNGHAALKTAAASASNRQLPAPELSDFKDF